MSDYLHIQTRGSTDLARSLDAIKMHAPFLHEVYSGAYATNHVEFFYEANGQPKESPRGI